MKKYAALCLAALLLVLPLAGCASSAPTEAQLLDTVESLVTQSYALNDLLFGYGLPVYEVTSPLSDFYHVYDDDEYAAYEDAMSAAPFSSVDEIKERLYAVYTADYADSLCSILFDGYLHEGQVVRAQIGENETGLTQSVSYTPLITSRLTYDFSSIRVIKPSSEGLVNLEISACEEGKTEPLTIRLRLVLEKNGWRLDSPTY